MPPKKILIFAPYGSYRVHHQVDAMLGSALRQRGCEVSVILCDGLLENCPVAGRPPNPAQCRACAESGRDFFGGFPIESLQMRSLLSAEDFLAARTWSDGLRPEDMPNASFEGMRLGLWTNSTMYQYFLSGRLDPRDEAIARVYRSFLYNSALIVRGLGRALALKKPDRLLCFSGINAFYRVALEVAKAHGVRPLVHERGYIDDSFVLPDSGFPHQDGNLADAWEHWRGIPLSESECAETQRYFQEREQGKNANWIPFYSFTSDADAARKTLRIPGGAKVVGLFTSSDWEVGMTLSYMEITFASQIEWMKVTAKACEEEGAYLVIRHHPNNVTPSRIAFRFLEEVLALAEEFPANVRVIMPDEKVTSYALLWTVDVAVTLFTTVGAEAFIRGVPTLCLGDYMYRHMGMVWVRSKQEYPPALKAALRGPDTIRIEDLQRAYRFAYLIFFRLAFRFRSFGIKDIHSPDIRVRNLDDLAPGKDETLDRVCDHILLGTPIYPLADGARSDAGEERAFLERTLSECSAKRRRARAMGWEKNPSADLTVSIVQLRGRDQGAASTLGASLKRSRHRNMEVIPVRIPEGLEPSGAAAFLARAVDSCRGDFVYLGHDSVRLDESAFSTCLDAFMTADPPMDAAAWGAWLYDRLGAIVGEALTARSGGAGFDALAGIHPSFARPFPLLSLCLWRKSALRSFLAGFGRERGATWNSLAREVFEKISIAGSGMVRFDQPMGVLQPEEESMDAPERDVAWLMEIAGRLPEAEAGYRKLLRDDPDDRASLLSFARLLDRQGKKEEVQAVVAPYLSRHGSDPELAALIGQAGPVQGRMTVTTTATAAAAPPPAPVRESWKPAAHPGYATYAEVAHLVDAVPGWLLEGQEKFLFDKVKSLPDGALILEIGSERGRSTTAMAFACVGSRKRIYSIDTFCGNDSLMELTKDFIEEWRANLAKNGLDGFVTPVKGYSYDVLPVWQGPTQFDFTFIDASHEYVDVLKDFQLVYPMIKQGGWMAFHDVEPGWPGPWRAWIEYGKTLLTDHETVATLSCGRKSRVMDFGHVDSRHSDFSFAREYKDYLVDMFKGGAAVLTDAMEKSLTGSYVTSAEKDATHAAEILLGGMPEHVPFRTTLRSMLSKDARLDGHLLLWNAMTLMAEAKWEESYRALLDATRVSRPVPVDRVRGYCQVLREKLGAAGRSLPEPGAPSFASVSADASGGASGAGHYGQDYFNWQKHIGAFGGVANLFKFREFIKPSDTVVDLGSGGGYLLRNVDAARKMGVEINPAARREASLHAGIDAVESPLDLPDAYADIVLSNHALEHMHSPLDVLRSLLPKLKVGGKLVLVVPSEPPQQEWDPKDINKHLFTWNPMTLGNLVELAGYKVLQVEAIQHQWIPDFMQAFQRLGEEGFHRACREHARRNGNYQIRVVAVRDRAAEEPSHRFSVGRKLQPAASEIPVALMTYRRPEHTAKVLKALEALGARNLYIFSDGPKSEADREAVEKTRKLCRSLPWADLKYEESRENRGLARSIMRATDQVLDRHEHLILLEDDCVPQKYFLDFMGRCLEKYRDDQKVYGVSGYSVPLPESLRRSYPYDAYFFPRIGSWGWATWKRAWEHLDRNLAHAYATVREQGIDIHQGGNDIQGSVEGMLRDQVKDVWTLNWVLSVYARGGLFAYPKESHIQNIGFDGTGVHCGATDKYDTLIASAAPDHLPPVATVDPVIARHFRSFYDVG